MSLWRRLLSRPRKVSEGPVGEIIVVAASAYCLGGTIIAIALCSGARGSTPPVAARVELAAPEIFPSAREA